MTTKKTILVTSIGFLLATTSIVFLHLFKKETGYVSNQKKELNQEQIEKERKMFEDKYGFKLGENNVSSQYEKSEDNNESEYQGNILGIGEIQIVVENSGETEAFFISASTPVFEFDGKEKALLNNLKKGESIKLFYNESTKTVNSILILKENNE